MLRAGGSAVDAALATNVALAVLEPMMCGCGGDLMAIVWDGESLSGYNGAGRSSHTFTYADMASELARIDSKYIPTVGPLAVTVPGAPRGWCDLSARYGKLPFADLFAPAIDYARNGAPVPQIIASEWEAPANNSAATSGGRYPHALDGWHSTFTIEGRVPVEGDFFRNPALADTLQAIADGGCDAFYKGAIAEELVRFSAVSGLHITASDLALHTGEWVTPVNTTYRNTTTLCELPPNPQGAAALEMLNILEGFPLAEWGVDSPDFLHASVEAKKLAFADASRYFADPEFSHVPLEGLISKEYAAQRRALIDMAHAAQTDAPGTPPGQRFEDVYGGDTTYLAAADSTGMMVSLIQSLYTGFGSGLVSPALGFALQSRGALFSMDAASPNVYAPGKRPFHTIAPAFAFRNGEPWLAFGVMGGFLQPQGQVQVITHMIDGGLDVQAAGDAARFAHDGSTQPTGQKMFDGGILQLEPGVCDATVAELQTRGHVITRGANTGGYQAIELRGKLAGGEFLYAGASEFRKDGAVAAL